MHLGSAAGKWGQVNRTYSFQCGLYLPSVHVFVHISTKSFEEGGEFFGHQVHAFMQLQHPLHPAHATVSCYTVTLAAARFLFGVSSGIPFSLQCRTAICDSYYSQTTILKQILCCKQWHVRKYFTVPVILVLLTRFYINLPFDKPQVGIKNRQAPLGKPFASFMTAGKPPMLDSMVLIASLSSVDEAWKHSDPSMCTGWGSIQVV